MQRYYGMECSLYVWTKNVWMTHRIVHSIVMKAHKRPSEKYKIKCHKWWAFTFSEGLAANQLELKLKNMFTVVADALCRQSCITNRHASSKRATRVKSIYMLRLQSEIIKWNAHKASFRYINFMHLMHLNTPEAFESGFKIE